MDKHEFDPMGREMSWYGWGSPLGLGLFLLLVAVGVTLLRFAFR